MENISQQERDLVLARLEIISPEIHFSSGSGATYSRNEMLDLVRAGDSAGNDFIKMQMEFMRAIKDGRLAGAITI